jgi:hypothetical protein
MVPPGGKDITTASFLVFIPSNSFFTGQSAQLNTSIYIQLKSLAFNDFNQSD